MPPRTFGVRELVLVPAALLIGALLLYELPPLGLPAAAAVIGRFAVSGASAGTAVIALAVIVGAGLTGPAKLAMAIPCMAAIALAAREVRAGRSGRALVTISVSAFAGYLGTTALYYAASGLGLLEGVQAEFSAGIGLLDAALGSGSSEALRESVDLVVRVWPGSVFLLVALGAYLATRTLIRIGTVQGHPDVAPFAPLERATIDWRVIWLLIAGLVAVAGASLMEQADSAWATVGWNAIWIPIGLFAVQGLGVAESAMKKVGMGGFFRLFIYGILLVTGVIGTVLAVVGVADLWLDFRKLRVETAAPDGTDDDPPSAVE